MRGTNLKAQNRAPGFDNNFNEPKQIPAPLIEALECVVNVCDVRSLPSVRFGVKGLP